MVSPMPRNPSKRSWRLLLLGAASVAIAACPGDDPPGDPDAVSMQVVLTTPSSDDGAVMLTITGPSTPTVEPVDASQRVYSRVLGNGSIRVAVMGVLEAGDHSGGGRHRRRRQLRGGAGAGRGAR